MAKCAGCRGDSYAGWLGKKPTGDVSLFWLCEACKPVPSMEPRKTRGLGYYRRFTYQILLPIMAAVFVMIELGIHA